MTSQYKLGMEVLGWLGILCILGAFTAVSFALIPAAGLAYPLLNGIGSGALIITSWYKNFLQLVVLNVVWLIVSVIALVRLEFWSV